MNSAELITALAKKLQLPKTEVTRLLTNTAELITTELVNNNIVSLHNMGNLEVKKKNERISVNPVSGKKMLTPPKLIVKFNASSSLKKKIKELKS